VRRNNPFRGLASVLSIWVAICLAAPMQLHTCVMHGGLAIDAAPNAAASMQHAHGAMSQNNARASASNKAVASHSHHQHSPDGQSKQCSCLGDCSAGGKAPIGVAAPIAQLASARAESSRADFIYASPSLVASHFLLPFSNGPPVTSSRA
jgi:hypothetical protein